MAFFITFIICDIIWAIEYLSLIFLLFLVWFAGFDYINSSSQNRAFLELLTFTPLTFTFFLLPSLIRDLSVFKTMKKYRFSSLKLRFFNPRVFNKAVLTLNNSKIDKSNALRIMLICFLSNKVRPKY